MSRELSEQDAGQVREILVAMGQAWERADGAGFAAAFAVDADFVNILGMSTRNRAEIASWHQRIFDTIYRGSRVVFEHADARALTAEITLAQVRSTLDAPSGLRPGITRTLVDCGAKPVGFRLRKSQRSKTLSWLRRRPEA